MSFHFFLAEVGKCEEFCLVTLKNSVLSLFLQDLVQKIMSLQILIGISCEEQKSWQVHQAKTPQPHAIPHPNSPTP